jgi:hypothetical protein
MRECTACTALRVVGHGDQIIKNWYIWPCSSSGGRSQAHIPPCGCSCDSLQANTINSVSEPAVLHNVEKHGPSKTPR